MRAATVVASDRAAAIEVAGLTALVGTILIAAQRPAVMTVAVAAIAVARLLAWSTLPRTERGSLAGELLLVAVCTAIGAANDWNTVVVHRVYDYRVPHGLPIDHAIPPWMLAGWGLILRALITVARWRRLDPPRELDDRVGLGARRRRHPRLRVLLLLGLVALTRQAIYRWPTDPWLSWAPFAAALVAYALLLGVPGGTRRLLIAVVLIGTAVEALLIQVAGLHDYSLGWFAGVPLWISLWWGLGTVVLVELMARAAALLPQRRCDPGDMRTAARV